MIPMALESFVSGQLVFCSPRIGELSTVREPPCRMSTVATVCLHEMFVVNYAFQELFCHMFFKNRLCNTDSSWNFGVGELDLRIVQDSKPSQTTSWLLIDQILKSWHRHRNKISTNPWLPDVPETPRLSLSSIQRNCLRKGVPALSKAFGLLHQVYKFTSERGKGWEGCFVLVLKLFRSVTPAFQRIENAHIVFMTIYDLPISILLGVTMECLLHLWPIWCWTYACFIPAISAAQLLNTYWTWPTSTYINIGSAKRNYWLLTNYNCNPTWLTKNLKEENTMYIK